MTHPIEDSRRPQPAPPNGIVETCIDVRDIEQSKRFYSELFGYEVLSADEHFCALCVGEQQVLLMFLRDRPPHASYAFGEIPAHGTTGRSHIGFRIPKESIEQWRTRLQERGIPLESMIEWPRGGISLYFRDPDGHLLELLTPGVWQVY